MNRSKSMWMAQAACLLIAVSSAAMSAEKASDIRKQMSKLEDEYFALYNKLNTDRQYDMVCRKEAQTGSRFLKRVCKPRYLESAQQSAASGACSRPSRPALRHPPIRAGPTSARHPHRASGTPVGGLDEGFRKNMLDVLQKSPELQALGKKRDELQERLNAATK